MQLWKNIILHLERLKSKMKTIAKFLLPIIITSASLVSCTNKPKIAEIPNLGVVEIPFYQDGKGIIKAQVIDVDNDLEVDGILGDGYLLMYKEGYQNHPDFKSHYDSSKSLPLNKNGVERLSDKLRENNYQEHIKSLGK